MRFVKKKMSEKRRKAIIKRRIFLSVCSLILVLAIGLVAFMIHSAFSGTKSPSLEESNISQEDKPEIKETFATVLSTGDIMCHSTQFKGARTATGEYDFSAFFKEASPYYKKADLAVANLEVTFGGTESGAYRGYPTFNTPDSLADAIKDSGLNFLLTSNNHSYDTGLFGLKRTLQVLKQKNLDFIGTRETDSEEIYKVKEINGIKIGMADYTYETTGSQSERKYLNGTIISQEANNLIASFSYNKIDAFYTEAQTVINDMKIKGAEFIVFYMHWGEEYHISPSTWQKSIAQELCNMGVDMIIGSHPHVVQPIELVYSEDGENTTICFYSQGNAVSNQRQGLISSIKTAHTEDGTMLTYTLKKYGDKVTLTDIDIIPTWVDRYKGVIGYLYTIYPIEQSDWGSSKYGLNSITADKISASYNRTKEIVATGLTQIQEKIGCETTFKIQQ